MFNRTINKRAIRGLKLFAIFSLLIILIGLVMLLTKSFAYGYFDTRLSRGNNNFLNGKQVIILGCIMLGVDVMFYLMFSEKKVSR